MSQFTIYRSTDTGAPTFYGTTGSYVMLLDACLVNGYGTQPGAGWKKPFANTSSVPTAVNATCGGWQQPTGSGFYVFINDGAPNATSLYRECWATGWESLVAASASVSNTVGSGSGQFPLPGQSLTTGHVVIRKSTTSDSSSIRQWIVVADSSSFYSFIQPNDLTSTTYFGFGFGDIYSFKNSNTTGNDAYKCIILGRNAENTNVASSDGFDTLSAIGTITVSSFMARSYTQLSSSITIGKHGDGVKGSTTTFLGNIPFPNSVDNALYVSPIWVCENATSIVRGQLRGLYQVLHPITNFVDGQTFNGALDYNGKTFMIIKQTPANGIYGIETSNTLPTN